MSLYCCFSSLLRRHFFVLFILSRHISLSFLIFLLLLQLFLLVHFPCLHFISLASSFFCFSYNYSFSFTFPVFISFIRLSSTSHVSSALPFILILPSLPSSTLFHLLLFSPPAVMLPFAFYCPQTASCFYSSSHLLLSPPTKPCPAPSASH